MCYLGNEEAIIENGVKIKISSKLNMQGKFYAKLLS